jgi:outer membrane protein TolC
MKASALPPLAHPLHFATAMMRHRITTAFLAILAALVPATTLSLDEAIRIGLQGNPRLQVQDLSADLAQARISQARKAMLPTLRGAAGMTNNWKKPNLEGTPQGYVWNTEAGLTLSQTIYSALTHTGIAIARQGQELNKLTSISQREELVLQLSSLYWEIVWMEDNRTSLRSSRTNLEHIAQTVQAQLENGVARKSDLNSANLAFRNVEASIELLSQQIAAQKNLLLLAVGKEPDSALVLTDSLNAEAATDTLTESVPTSQKLLHEQIRAKELEVSLANASRYPSVSLFVKYGTQGNSDHFDFQNKPSDRFTDNGAVGIQVDVPFFDGGAASSASTIAQIEKRQLELEYASQKLSQRSEVANARKALETARSQVTRQLGDMALTCENFQMREEEYKQQITSLADLLRAESEAIAARSNLAEARYKERIARLELERALGLLARRAH